MANDEVLGPRKTMFVLVIVVGCFAVLWPRILSPLILGHTQEQLKPNQFDREAALKQERSPIRGMGPHPALRERGRAIPPGVPPVQPRPPTPLPPHVRVRTSPLSVYYDVEIKPPPIPGMRPPLGSPGGPVPAPKSSMGFVMPIYTICIIVFFVYTLSKILFKRTGSPYESVAPDPQFRRRVFRDNSRSSPDKLGDVELEALRARLAETERAMQRIVRQLALHDAEAQDNTRPYTNGTILLNSGPVQIIASEFQENKDKNQSEQKDKPKDKETTPDVELTQSKETENGEKDIDTRRENTTYDLSSEPLATHEEKPSQDNENVIESEVIESQVPENNVEIKEAGAEKITKQEQDQIPEDKIDKEIKTETSSNKTEEIIIKPDDIEVNGEELRNKNVDLIALSEGKEISKEVQLAESTESFIEKEKGENNDEKRSRTELLEEALMEELLKDEEEEQESPSVKHEAADVKSIYLETEIPQQTRVLVADFADNTDRHKPAKHAPLVVSGKMTLSLIQDAPRDTPERDPESTMDDFTTASAMTQPAEKEDDLSEEEIEEEIEEIEIEEEIIEEEIEEEEIEEDDEEIDEPKNALKTNK
ncbi:resistance to inhibitors of cholinesterase protein 3 isoform X4 [Papilio machaon]|uniref:resistance to inhibitors of cholinesterase protein 3 isoform X4 n=1 Tax=Papilio machaon TaxID=76193 RepID=UPI001E6638E1|nr:resistance to inhibitors of cholinesterase protein 3 isoform X4 [Papilio machaon]